MEEEKGRDSSLSSSNPLSFLSSENLGRANPVPFLRKQSQKFPSFSDLKASPEPGEQTNLRRRGLGGDQNENLPPSDRTPEKIDGFSQQIETALLKRRALAADDSGKRLADLRETLVFDCERYRECPASRKSRRATMYAGGAEDFEVKRRSAFIHAADRATIRLEKRAAYFRDGTDKDLDEGRGRGGEGGERGGRERRSRVAYQSMYVSSTQGVPWFEKIAEEEREGGEGGGVGEGVGGGVGGKLDISLEVEEDNEGSMGGRCERRRGGERKGSGEMKQGGKNRPSTTSFSGSPSPSTGLCHGATRRRGASLPRPLTESPLTKRKHEGLKEILWADEGGCFLSTLKYTTTTATTNNDIVDSDNTKRGIASDTTTLPPPLTGNLLTFVDYEYFKPEKYSFLNKQSLSPLSSGDFVMLVEREKGRGGGGVGVGEGGRAGGGVRRRAPRSMAARPGMARTQSELIMLDKRAKRARNLSKTQKKPDPPPEGEERKIKSFSESEEGLCVDNQETKEKSDWAKEASSEWLDYAIHAGDETFFVQSLCRELLAPSHFLGKNLAIIMEGWKRQVEKNDPPLAPTARLNQLQEIFRLVTQVSFDTYPTMVESPLCNYYVALAIHFAIIPQNYSLIFGFYTEIHQKEDNLFASVVNSLLAEGCTLESMGIAPRFQIPGPLKKERKGEGEKKKEKEGEREKREGENEEEKKGEIIEVKEEKKKEGSEENEEEAKEEAKEIKEEVKEETKEIIEEGDRHISYYEAILELKKVEKEHLPSSKLQVVLSAYREICSAVATHYEDSEKQVLLGADDLLPIFSYCIVHSQMANGIAQLEFLSDFILEEDLNGEMGYILATLHTSLHAVCAYRKK